jgi:hypothetical protein
VAKVRSEPKSTGYEIFIGTLSPTAPGHRPAHDLAHAREGPSTFTGYLANLFLTPRAEDTEEPGTAEAMALAAAERERPGQAGEQGGPSDAEAVTVPAATMDDLRALLAVSESKLTEMRLFLGEPGSNQGGAGSS